jgi:hypothetical protein
MKISEQCIAVSNKCLEEADSVLKSMDQQTTFDDVKMTKYVYLVDEAEMYSVAAKHLIEKTM